jgi:hypothetical protein
VLGNKKPNPDLWKANDRKERAENFSEKKRKERAEKINACTNTQIYVVRWSYAHGTATIFFFL